MYEQKLREHQKAFDAQEKQIAALKKSGKSTNQAIDIMKGRADSKQNTKQAKKKKGQSTMGNEEHPPPAELLTKIKEYSVKFVFPDPPKLSPPVLGLYSKCLQTNLF
jgi:ATP-binding cassette subfamily F protein 1